MLIILSGVAGAGKDTVKKEIMKLNKMVETLPSFTDRPVRATDEVGVTYNFVTTEQFEEMIKNGELYEYSKHHNHYYGTSRKLLNEKIKNNKIIIKDIDVNGTEQLVELLKNDIKVVTIFLRVPKEELRNRLYQREEYPNEDEINLRLERFDYEESKISAYDYVLKNTDLQKTVKIIMNIIEAERDSKI